MGLSERKQTTKFYHELVFAKIAGKITQDELNKRLRSGVPVIHPREIDHKSAAAGEKEL